MNAPVSPFQLAADELARRDAKLRVAIELVGPCLLAPDTARSPYQALLSAIAHQQVHGAAAAAILGRLQRLYAPAGRWPAPAELADTPEALLRGAGLSRTKVLAMKDVAARTLDGTVPDREAIAALDDERIIERLDVVRGVGRWTAEMLLIFTLGRPDVLPVDDFGVRYGFQLLHGKRQMPKPKWLAAYGERWAPLRSTASWYLWRYVDRLRAERRDPAQQRRRKAARPPAGQRPAAAGTAARKGAPSGPRRRPAPR